MTKDDLLEHVVRYNCALNSISLLLEKSAEDETHPALVTMQICVILEAFKRLWKAGEVERPLALPGFDEKAKRIHQRLSKEANSVMDTFMGSIVVENMSDPVQEH